MRILLTATASYSPPRGGATRSNLIWLDYMANFGHECRIVCGPSGEGAMLQHNRGIAILPVEDPARRVQVLRQQIHEFHPDWVLVSSEDLGMDCCAKRTRRAGPRGLPGAHTAVLPVWTGKLESGPAGGGPGGAVGGDRGDRPPHGGVRRA
jgi:hypothetical protein